MKKTLIHIFLLVGLAIIFRSLIDIFLWQRIFETNVCKVFWDAGHSCPYVGNQPGQYHFGLRLIDYSLIAVGVFGVLFESKYKIISTALYGLTYITLVNAGLTDILYYWLDGKNVPKDISWLWFIVPGLESETNITLFVNVILHLMLWMIIYTSIYIIFKKFKITRRLAK